MKACRGEDELFEFRVMSALKTALLKILAGGDNWGGAMICELRKDGRCQVRMMQGRIYPALRELEADGFLTSYEGEPLPERGGRSRRYYRLTEKAKVGR